MKEINDDINSANTLSGDFYSSDLTFNQVKLKIFEKSWQFITCDHDLKLDNSAVPFVLLSQFISEPLLLLKNKNEIVCMSNVCTHRGNVLIEEKTIIKNNITCGYHGKSFNSKGKFVFMPETDGMKNFPCADDDLTHINLKQWFQFLFISLDPIVPFNVIINDMQERVSWMPIGDFVFSEDLSKSYEIDANWALYCDNYLEGFHIPFIHKDLNATLDYKKYDVEIFEYSNLQIGYAEKNHICFEIPKLSKDYGKNIAAYYFWIFPNMMFNFYPWGLSVNIVKPLSPKKTIIEFKSFVWDESKLDKGAGADLDKVELEDEEIVQRVQKGVSSRFYNQGRFSPKMEKGVHHFHTLISRFMFK
jgi:choline monooxygenase